LFGPGEGGVWKRQLAGILRSIEKKQPGERDLLCLHQFVGPERGASGKRQIGSLTIAQRPQKNKGGGRDKKKLGVKKGTSRRVDYQPKLALSVRRTRGGGAKKVGGVWGGGEPRWRVEEIC